MYGLQRDIKEMMGKLPIARCYEGIHPKNVPSFLLFFVQIETITNKAVQYRGDEPGCNHQFDVFYRSAGCNCCCDIPFLSTEIRYYHWGLGRRKR